MFYLIHLSFLIFKYFKVNTYSETAVRIAVIYKFQVCVCWDEYSKLFLETVPQPQGENIENHLLIIIIEKEAVPVEARAHGPLVSPSTELGARRRDLLEKWWPSECETRST